MAKYRKKPVVVEAFMFSGGEVEPGWPVGWLKSKHHFPISGTGRIVVIETLKGKMNMSGLANIGDYIIRDVKNEFYPCKHDIFEATYEKVEE